MKNPKTKSYGNVMENQQKKNQKNRKIERKRNAGKHF